MGWRILSPSERARKVAPNELPRKRLDDLLLLAQQDRTSLLGLPSTAPLGLTCQVLIVSVALVTLVTLHASHRFHQKTSLRQEMRCEMFRALSDEDGLADEPLLGRCGRQSVHGFLTHWETNLIGSCEYIEGGKWLGMGEETSNLALAAVFGLPMFGRRVGNS